VNATKDLHHISLALVVQYIVSRSLSRSLTHSLSLSLSLSHSRLVACRLLLCSYNAHGDLDIEP